MAAIRKVAAILAAPVLLGSAMTGPAAAEPDATAALPCGAGWGCFYNINDQRCQWQFDNRQHANDCSWAGNTDGTGNVFTIANRKSAYLCFYRAPNYVEEEAWGWVAPNRSATMPGTFKVLSHRWVADPANC